MRKSAILCSLMMFALLGSGILAGCGGQVEDTAEWHTDHGIVLAEEGRYEEAIAQFTKAIELNPQYALAYNNRGLVYYDLGQFERAIDDFYLRQIEWAIQDFDEAIRLMPQFTDAYNNRGVAYTELGLFERAIDDFDEAIRLNPQHTMAYANRTLAHTLLGMDAEAEQDFSRAVELGFPPDILEKEIERLKRQR